MRICCFLRVYIVVVWISVGWKKQASWRWTYLSLAAFLFGPEICLCGCQVLLMLCFVLLGPEGLLWSPHIWTAVKPWSFHPHQLDGPRWKCLLLILQCLRFLCTSLKNTKKTGGGGQGEVICERRRHVTHSIFITMPEYLGATHPNNDLNPTFYSFQRRVVAVLFIKKWNHRLCALLTLHPVCFGVATEECWLHLNAIDIMLAIRLTLTCHVGPRVHRVNTGLRWTVALYCIRLNKDFNPFIISLYGPYSLGAVNRIVMCLCVALN